ncbi:hypothetical protein V493_00726 [Pseudogymnoascus sp. VKM F-4281 (FW-2241)]|nr:hypothetical protein V493_00726 [Pseudogymnoascus sp. VKM F-4281 (FW-2241)]
MSEQRLKWDGSEVSRLRELYLTSPDMSTPLLTEAFNFNMTTPRHRTKNAVKCQLRIIRAELEEGIPTTSAAPATRIPRNLLNEQADITCQICHDRSTWSILHEGYRRIEAAHHYALKLERDQIEAANALAQCRDALTTTAAEVDEERLDHRATKEALGFEQAMHKQTISVLERVFEEARVSGELADHLRYQIAALQRTPSPQIVHVPVGAVLELEGSTPTQSNLALLDETVARPTPSPQIVQVPPRAVLELEGSTPTQNNLALLEEAEAKSTTGNRGYTGESIQTKMTRFPDESGRSKVLLKG